MSYGIPEQVLPCVDPIMLAQTDPRVLVRPCRAGNELVPGRAHAGPQKGEAPTGESIALSTRHLLIRAVIDDVSGIWNCIHPAGDRQRPPSMTFLRLDETCWRSGGGKGHEDPNYATRGEA